MSMLPNPFLLMITRCVGAALIKLEASASRPLTGHAQVLLITIPGGHPKSPTLATGSETESTQNPPPRPPGISQGAGYAPTPSACEPHREWIEQQVRLGRNATAIYQELVG